MKAKNLSLISKGIAIIFAIIAFIFFDKTAGDIIMISGFIAGAFLPVDISMIKNSTAEKKP